MTPSQETPTSERLSSVVGERGQVVIPKALRTRLGISHGDTMDFVLEKGRLTLRPRRDLSSVRATIAKFGGMGRAQMLADGFRDTDEMLEDMRGR